MLLRPIDVDQTTSGDFKIYSQIDSPSIEHQTTKQMIDNVVWFTVACHSSLLVSE